MQAIKALVVGLGFLIVASMGLLIYGFYSGFADRDPDLGIQGSNVESQPAASQTAGIALPVPPSCQIVDAVGDGRRVIVRTSGDAGCERVFVIDTKSNAIISRVRIGP